MQKNKQDKTVEFEETQHETYPPKEIRVSTTFLTIFFIMTLTFSIIGGMIAGHLASEKRCHKMMRCPACEQNDTDARNNNINKEKSTEEINNSEKNDSPRIGIIIAQTENGVFVAEVQGENAKNAGLQPGDQILSYDGIQVKNITDVTENVNTFDWRQFPRACPVG